MADDLAAAGGPGPQASQATGAAARRTLGELIRYGLGVVIGVVVLALLFGRRSELAAAVRQLGGARPAWVAAAVGAEVMSMLGYSRLQQWVLRLGGATIPLPGLFLLSLANDAIAITVPGGAAVASAYRYRYYRRRGASAATAGWTVFTILIAQAVGMSLLLLVGVLVALAATAAGRAGTGAASLGVTALGLLIVLAAGAVLVRRDLVLGLASAVTGRLRRYLPAGRHRGRAQATGDHPVGLLAKIEATLARMRDIPLTPRATVGVSVLATAIWTCDFTCLLCSFRAVGAAIPWHGVLLAYGAAVVAGSLPIVPGGLGIVEGSLAVVLIGYGASRVQAVSAVLAFRIVTYWSPIIFGWISVGLVALLLRHRPAGDDPARADALT